MSTQQTQYLVGESFRTLRHHKGIMLLSVLIMSLTLLVLAVFLLITENVTTLVDNARDELEVYVYLKDGVLPYQVEQNHKHLLAMPEVDEIHFISKAQALDDFKQELGDEAHILEALEANPLPASFKIRLKEANRNPADLEAFADKAAAFASVEEVAYGKEFLDRFATLARIFLVVDIALGIIVILSAIFVISNTVRLTILTRKKTIEILKLVGATNHFIRVPFVIEGSLQGGFAAVLSLLMLFGVHAVVQNFVPGLTFLGAGTIALYIVVCTTLGGFGSFASLGRFLKL